MKSNLGSFRSLMVQSSSSCFTVQGKRKFSVTFHQKESHLKKITFRGLKDARYFFTSFAIRVPFLTFKAFSKDRELVSC